MESAEAKMEIRSPKMEIGRATSACVDEKMEIARAMIADFAAAHAIAAEMPAVF
jgi:hypothetical protein